MNHYARSTRSIKIAQKMSSGGARVVSPDEFSVNKPLHTSSTGTTRSQSIPISSKGMHRTPSEIQLCQDEALADYRDYCMYSRIVDGISRRSSANYENDACIANIQRTRCQPPEESMSLQARHESLLHTLGNPHAMVPQDQTMWPSEEATMILDEEEIFVMDF